MDKNNFKKAFPMEKPIIGMIHLSGNFLDHKIKRASKELKIYENAGVNGAIIENYHATRNETIDALKELSKIELDLILGINILGDPYLGFDLANEYDLKFVQFDSIQEKDIQGFLYEHKRQKFPEAIVLGGVGFKYISPTNNPLESDLECAKTRCEAIVTTGSGTGITTPLEKLQEYKTLLGDFPLIVGAGVKLKNVNEQLKYADGAIVGSYFKENYSTFQPINEKRVDDFMDAVRKIRGS